MSNAFKFEMHKVLYYRQKKERKRAIIIILLYMQVNNCYTYLVVVFHADATRVSKRSEFTLCIL